MAAPRPALEAVTRATLVAMVDEKMSVFCVRLGRVRDVGKYRFSS